MVFKEKQKQQQKTNKLAHVCLLYYGFYTTAHEEVTIIYLYFGTITCSISFNVT